MNEDIRAKIVLISFVLMQIFAFSILVIVAYAQQIGYDVNEYLFSIILAFFILVGGSLILVFKNLKLLTLFEGRKIINNCKNKKVIKADFLSYGAITSLVGSLFDSTSVKYPSIKKYTQLRGFITYHIRILDFDSSYDLEVLLLKEIAKFSNSRLKCNNPVLLLVVYLDKIEDIDIEILKSISTRQAIVDELCYDSSTYYTLAILVDKSTNKSYYINTSKTISIERNKYACRFVRKYLGKVV